MPKILGSAFLARFLASPSPLPTLPLFLASPLFPVLPTHLALCRLFERLDARLGVDKYVKTKVGTICGLEWISASRISSCVGFRLLSSRCTCLSFITVN